MMPGSTWAENTTIRRPAATRAGNLLGDHLSAQFEVEHDHVRPGAGLAAEIGEVGCHLGNADPPGRVTVHPGRDALDHHRVILDDSDGYLTFHLASTHSTSSSRWWLIVTSPPGTRQRSVGRAIGHEADDQPVTRGRHRDPGPGRGGRQDGDGHVGENPAGPGGYRRDDADGLEIGGHAAALGHVRAREQLMDQRVGGVVALGEQRRSRAAAIAQSRRTPLVGRVRPPGGQVLQQRLHRLTHGHPAHLPRGVHAGADNPLLRGPRPGSRPGQRPGGPECPRRGRPARRPSG